jgi:hypothetical protein
LVIFLQWSERVKNQGDQIAALYMARRKAMSAQPDVHLSDLLAAREDLAIIEKTSSASVRKNTQTAINKVIIGRVCMYLFMSSDKTQGTYISKLL